MPFRLEEHRKALAALAFGAVAFALAHFLPVLGALLPSWADGLAAAIASAVAAWAVENRVGGWNVQEMARFLDELLAQADAEEETPEPAPEAPRADLRPGEVVPFTRGES